MILNFLLAWLAIGLSSPSEQTQCEDVEGGKWEKVGMAQSYQCVHTFSDGGKPCWSSEECEHVCIFRDLEEEPTCKGDDNDFGCYGTIEGYPLIMCRD